MDNPITLLHKDAESFLAASPDKSADLVLFSPPYGKEPRSATSYGLRARRSRDANTVKWSTLPYRDERRGPEYEAWLQLIVWHCLRISRGLVCMVHQIVGMDTHAQHPVSLLHPFRDRLWSEIIIAKPSSMQMNCRKPALSHEVVLSYGNPHWWNQRAAHWRTVWHISPRRSAEHPCPMSLKMSRRLIRAWCPPGGVVCDPFFGIGTVAVAAMQTGRRFVGCEIEAEYYDKALRHVREEQDRSALFPARKVVRIPSREYQKSLDLVG